MPNHKLKNVICGMMLLLLGVLTLRESRGANQVWKEDAESAQVSWKLARSDAKISAVQQQRKLGNSPEGQWHEEIKFTAGNGTYAYISRQIPKCEFLADTTIHATVRSDRPSVQLMAQVVFPKAKDPQSGQPLSALISGSSYKNIGLWEELKIDNIPLLVSRQARVLRAAYGSNIDLSNSYLNMIVINGYSGSGPVTIAWDKVQISGFSPIDKLPEVALANFQTETPQAPSLPEVKMQGSILTIQDKPFFPRVIEYQGEPLKFLAGLGFNAVRLSSVPTEALLREAREANIWIVAPPPLDQLQAMSQQYMSAPGMRGNAPAFDARWDGVLVWALGYRLNKNTLPKLAEVTQQLKTTDTRRSRPTICGADQEVRAISRYVDLLSISRWPLGTSLELTDYHKWMEARSRLARPGTPFWAVIATQPAAQTIAQCGAISGRDWHGAMCEPDAIRTQVWLSIGAGARALEFASASRLDQVDGLTKMRATTLELINREIELVEPWAAAGTYVGTVLSDRAVVKGVLLQYNSSYAMIVTRTAPGSQQVPQHAEEEVRFVVQGIPESAEIYELNSASMSRMSSTTKRVTGGVGVTLKQFDDLAMVVFSSDQTTISGVYERLDKVTARSIDLQRELARQQFTMVEQVEKLLPPRIKDDKQVADAYLLAKKLLGKSDEAFTHNDRRAAFIDARRALTQFGIVKRSSWERATQVLGSQVASPLSGSYATLPDHWIWIKQLKEGRFPQENRLPRGDMEDSNGLVQAGWSYTQFAPQNITATVEVVADASNTGSGNALRMNVQLPQPEALPENSPMGAGRTDQSRVDSPFAPPPLDRNPYANVSTSAAATNQPATPKKPKSDAQTIALLETPPLCLVTPAIPVQPGEWIAIRGRIRIPKAITASADGVMIVDSLGGEALAERFGVTKGWEDFVLYRCVPQGTQQMNVMFALTGLGEVFLDDVTVRPMGAMSGNSAMATNPASGMSAPTGNNLSVPNLNTTPNYAAPSANSPNSRIGGPPSPMNYGISPDR